MVESSTLNPAPHRRRRVVWAFGLACLLVAAISSGFLVQKHFGGTLPGCGPQSGCDALERSPLGRWPLPFTDGRTWPVSFLGLAYFASMGVAWFKCRRAVEPSIRLLTGAGAIASLVFVGAMLEEWKFCQYCAATHAANLAFVAALWRCVRLDARVNGTRKNADMNTTAEQQAPKRSRAGLNLGKASVSWLVWFVMLSVGLEFADNLNRKSQASSAEIERATAAQAMIDKATDTPLTEQPVDRWGAAGFTGRYRKGPESAAIRFVVLTDFQCPDCKRVESEIETILASRTDVSLSIKHFPMCTDCNTHAGVNMHPNACFAARAAEAAGILGGDDAFFKMAAWLFEVGGVFIKTEDLAKGVQRAGLSMDGFSAVMAGNETLKRVRGDVEDGIALGLYFTPMVFINGVEMKGWQVPGAIRKTVDQVVAASPPARTAASDRPPLAAQRYLDDWREQPVVTLPADQRSWSSGAAVSATPGPADPKPVTVVVFGDYSEPTTAKFDAQLREAMKDRANVRYTFRHYPLNPECNPALPPTMSKDVVKPRACIASRAAEAAGTAGGESGYWKMHAWLMANQALISEDKLAAVAAELGLDKEKFAAALTSSDVTAAIAEDSRAGQSLGLTNIPWVYVNNKRVPRPMRDGDNVIRRIIEAASKDKD